VTLETINSIAQIVAAVGVIASLFYLAAQIRQNTRSQRSIVVDSLTNSLIALLSPQAGLKTIVYERSQFSSHYLSFSRMCGSNSVKGRSSPSNGKVGIFTCGLTTIDRA
jgi:hypothetical protein